MSGTLSLNGTWDLGYAEGGSHVSSWLLMGSEVRGLRMMPARVPAPIHQVLTEAGVIDDPNFGTNSLKARWVEEMFWVYRRIFDAPAEAIQGRTVLSFDRLELETVVLLNGVEVGRHENAFRPARFDVTGALREGENLLVAKVSAGLHSAANKPSLGWMGTTEETGVITKRNWHRNPDYQSGWDWNPRLLNIGILGDVALTWHRAPIISQLTVLAVTTPDLSSATVHVRATVEGAGEGPARCTLCAWVVEAGLGASAEIIVGPGESRHEVTIELPNPRLWWPAGQGEQFRYTVEATLTCDDETQTLTRKLGVRRMELDQSCHPVEGRHFIVRINNRPIFCKGGNWAPADLYYGSVPEERFRRLVALAAEAHFTMFRVNGVGPYLEHSVCDACDEAGILLWHDFAFGCAQYPGTDPEFRNEVCREATWVVRELAHHPSLVLWCGSNEIEWGDWDWGYADNNPAHPHYALFHMYLPRIVRAENPSAVYWPASPWSPDDKDPNDSTVGDQHPWAASAHHPIGSDWWEYRRYVDRFANEGGIVGVSSPATLRQFMPEDERHILSASWEHHDNPFAFNTTRDGKIGRAYGMAMMWTGLDPLGMAMEDYAFVSALLQAEGLAEYANNYRRRMFSSAAAIFWSYNDSWPVTHGWTIVDYYLRRKLSFYTMKRAFQPVTVVVTDEGEQVTIYGVNDLPQEWAGELRSGLFGLSGGHPVDERLAVTLPPNASTPLVSMSRATWERLGTRQTGAFAVLQRAGRMVAQHRLLLERFKDLAFADAEITMELAGDTLTLTSDSFAWGVCLDLDGERPLADNCIDLLPDIPYAMPWKTEWGSPEVMRVGNKDAVKRG